MSLTPTARKDLQVGQLIWAIMLIPKNVMKRTTRKSGSTKRKILKGKKVLKLAYILEVKENDISVAYTTTFDSATNLEDEVVEPDDWCRDPIGGKSWIYLGPRIKIDDEPIDITTSTLSKEQVDDLLKLMGRRADLRAGIDPDQEVKEKPQRASEGLVSDMGPAPPASLSVFSSDSYGSSGTIKPMGSDEVTQLVTSMSQLVVIERSELVYSWFRCSLPFEIL
ncbi:hypothetical protein FRC10_006620 [Ceratobasidium sp. 414]|nr:hypothetical protein FRC10_006620 [Ceratobasidium sp. 414]